jgi:hypothetical protein
VVGKEKKAGKMPISPFNRVDIIRAVLFLVEDPAGGKKQLRGSLIMGTRQGHAQPERWMAASLPEILSGCGI